MCVEDIKAINHHLNEIDKKLNDLAACDHCGAVYLKKSLQKFNETVDFTNPTYSNLCPKCADFARKELRELY